MSCRGNAQQAKEGETAMQKAELLKRVSVDPNVAGGKPCITGTRILIATLLDGLAEGLSPEQLIDHYPQLVIEDIRAALAYAGELADLQGCAVVVDTDRIRIRRPR